MQVYVQEQGAVVRKKGGLLHITKGKAASLFNIEYHLNERVRQRYL